MTRTAVFGGAAAAGAAAGLVVALASGGSQRAVTTLAVARGSSLLASRTVASLAGSSTVASNVADGVHVSPAHVSDHLRARPIAGTALIELSYTDPSATRATQAVQQAATVLAALVPARLPGVRVSVVDPAYARPAPAPLLRDAAGGAFVCLVLTGLATLPRRVRRRVPAPQPVPVESPPSRARLEQQRERVPQGDPQPAPVPQGDPQPAPVAHPPPAAPPPLPTTEPGWVLDIRSALAAHGPEFGADRVAEWEAYLDAFAAQAVDGVLPPHLATICADVFEPLLVRARVTEETRGPFPLR